MKKLTFAIGLFGLCCLNDLHAQVVSTFAGTIGGPGSTDGTGTSARFNFPYSVCSDASGNLYVADFVSHKIRKISASGIVSTLAGSGLAGSANGTGSAASFNYPQGICADAAGNIYVGDTYNNMIRKITSAGVVSTFAGSGVTGNADGTGTGASFSHPQGICFDAGGNMYVADVGNHKIRKITPSGVVSTFAGSGIAGSADGTGTASSFNSPAGICIDANGDMYVSDSQNRKIRKVTLSGVVSTFAGSGASGATDGLGTAASFASPVGICIDASGTIYVADASNAKIRKINPSGLVSTFLGSGIAGDLDATGTAARFWNPYGICSDISGNLYIADSDNHKIKKSTPTGVVTTFAGSRALSGSTDGTGTSALFYNPQGLCSDASGNIYVADYSNQEIRQVTSSSVVTTFAGSTTPGSTNGTGSAASFFNPMGVCSDTYGNIYVADTYNHKIRKIAPSGAVTTFAGSGSAGSADGLGTAATFNEPAGVCSDINGNIYVADGASRKIRKVTPAGLVTTLAGSGAAGSTNGTGAAASFYYPQGICIDAAGDLYVADYPDHKVRKVSSAGLVTTFAGSGISGSTDGAAASATFYNPAGLCSDASGNIYVADFGNNKVRKITPSGIVSTLAGSGTPASDDGIGVSAGFSGPSGICLDASGNIFVSDYNTHKLRKITFCTEPPAPANNTASASMQVCVGNSTTLSAIGSGTVNWFSGSTGGMPIATGATISTSNTLTAGSYIYYAEDMTCMSSLTRTAISFTVNPKPTISVNSGLVCSGSSFSIVPGGADTYTISGGSFNVSPATTSTYSITGTSAQGCVSSNTAVSTVSVNASPIITAISNYSVICSGQSATLTAVGASTYTWNTGVSLPTITISPTVTTTYTVSGTNALGCNNSSTVTQSVSTCTGIESPSEPMNAISLFPNPGNGIFTIRLNATARVILTNHLGDIIFDDILNEGEQFIDIQQQASGMYIVTVKNDNNYTAFKLMKQ